MNSLSVISYTARIDCANREWGLLSEESRRVFASILEAVERSDHGFEVVRLAKTWVLLSHPSKPYTVQIIADNRGSNLDLSVNRPGRDNYGVSPVTTVKLLRGNENFSVQRIFAAFGLHDKLPKSNVDPLLERQISVNNRTYSDFQSEHLYLQRLYATEGNA